MASSNYSPAARAALAGMAGFTTALVAQTQADIAGTVPAGGTGATAGGWDTSGHRDTAITTLGEVKTVVNASLAALASMGLPLTVT
jgi:hypothetical protein